jgi:proteasome lid subunit RPN8/RPN11
MRNAQDEFHARDAKNFPRTSANAYFMDPAELLAVYKQARAKGEVIGIIYHSHIDAGSYFSAEDKKMAAPDGEPAYPEAAYMVVSVFKGAAKEYHFFDWNADQKDFVERKMQC